MKKFITFNAITYQLNSKIRCLVTSIDNGFEMTGVIKDRSYFAEKEIIRIGSKNYEIKSLKMTECNRINLFEFKMMVEEVVI